MELAEFRLLALERVAALGKRLDLLLHRVAVVGQERQAEPNEVVEDLVAEGAHQEVRHGARDVGRAAVLQGRAAVLAEELPVRLPVVEPSLLRIRVDEVQEEARTRAVLVHAPVRDVLVEVVLLERAQVALEAVQAVRRLAEGFVGVGCAEVGEPLTPAADDRARVVHAVRELVIEQPVVDAVALALGVGLADVDRLAAADTAAEVPQLLEVDRHAVAARVGHTTEQVGQEHVGEIEAQLRHRRQRVHELRRADEDELVRGARRGARPHRMVQRVVDDLLLLGRRVLEPGRFELLATLQRLAGHVAVGAAHRERAVGEARGCVHLLLRPLVGFAEQGLREAVGLLGGGDERFVFLGCALEDAHLEVGDVALGALGIVDVADDRLLRVFAQATADRLEDAKRCVVLLATEGAARHEAQVALLLGLDAARDDLFLDHADRARRHVAELEDRVAEAVLGRIFLCAADAELEGAPGVGLTTVGGEVRSRGEDRLDHRAFVERTEVGHLEGRDALEADGLGQVALRRVRVARLGIDEADPEAHLAAGLGRARDGRGDRVLNRLPLLPRGDGGVRRVVEVDQRTTALAELQRNAVRTVDVLEHLDADVDRRHAGGGDVLGIDRAGDLDGDLARAFVVFVVLGLGRRTGAEGTEEEDGEQQQDRGQAAGHRDMLPPRPVA